MTNSPTNTAGDLVTVPRENDVERTLEREFVCGFKVAAYRETHPEHGRKYGHTYSEHWSTPSTHPAVTVERLFTENQLRAALAASPAHATGAAMRERLHSSNVEWVTNDIAELGVKIGDQFFFLYKGRSLVYGELDTDPTKPPVHDDGSPMHWRPVFKREFGECAHPINYKDLTRIGTVSLDDSDEWKPLPAAALSSPAPEGEAAPPEAEAILALCHEITGDAYDDETGDVSLLDAVSAAFAVLRDRAEGEAAQGVEPVGPQGMTIAEAEALIEKMRSTIHEYEERDRLAALAPPSVKQEEAGRG